MDIFCPTEENDSNTFFNYHRVVVQLSSCLYNAQNRSGVTLTIIPIDIVTYLADIFELTTNKRRHSESTERE